MVNTSALEPPAEPRMHIHYLKMPPTLTKRLCVHDHAVAAAPLGLVVL
jgi:hypothetical protein